MTMPEWSAAQREAIQKTGKNLVVSASAGSGKTAVLTARMVKRITEDRIPVENMLAMTFTDAAASEMKNRLYSQLDDLRKNTNDSDLKTYLDNQCSMMGSAMICTIHSFCLNIIKENYYIIGLNPNRINKIFSEDEMHQIRLHVMEETLKTLKQKKEEHFQKAVCHFSARPDDYTGFTGAIEKLVNTALNQPDPQLYFQRILDKAAQPKTFADMDKEIQFYLFKRIALEMQMLYHDINGLEKCAIQEELDEAVYHSVLLKKEKLHPVFEAIERNDYREFIRILRNCAASPLKNAKSENYKALRKKINTQCQDLVEIWFDEDTLYYDQKHLQPVVEALVTAAETYLHLLEEMKEKKEGLDFSDMEHLAYQILSNPASDVAQRLKNRFDEILVDEFQDTNDFQNAMIEMISRGNNTFRVGDIKQSIYRFRNAKPQIMADLMKKNDDLHETIVLHHNYRSSRSVIEFNNLLFSHMLNVDGLSNEFTKDDHALVGTAQQDDQYRWPVTFIKIQKENESDDTLKPKAMILAQKILDMKNTSEFNHWRDYCVLVRSHAIKDEIRFVFEKLNIPYTTTLMSGFYKSSSIQILISWLSLLLNSSLDIACVSILTGIYHYTDEDLAELQLKRDKNSYCSIARKLNNQFDQDYQNLKQLLSTQGYTAVIQAILQINHFYWDSLDKKERANVDLFLSRAFQAQQRNTQLAVFLDEIEASMDIPSSTAVSASRNDDVVQITTVHQSKGLQYPVVFFWSNSRTVINDESSACMVDEKLGLGLYHLDHPYRYKRPTLQRMAIVMKNALEEFEENVRLYYVALTRAQKAGFIIDTVDENADFQPLQLSSFFEKKGSTALILAVLSQLNDPCFLIEEVSSSYRSKFTADKKVHNHQKLPRLPELPNREEIQIETPSSLEKQLLQPLTFQPKHGAKRGSRLHKTIELLPALPWSNDLIRSVNPQLRQNEINALIQLSINPLFIELNQKETHKEFSFATFQNQRIVHGFVDFLAIDATSFTIVDFKSDHNITEEELIERYQDQLNAYEENLKIIYPGKISSKLIYSFYLEKFINL